MADSELRLRHELQSSEQARQELQDKLQSKCNTSDTIERVRACVCVCKFTKQHITYSRRKFRSQTSDNMDRWKSRGGKSQRGEAKKWEEQRVRRNKMQVREKVGKSWFTVFFQWFVALGGLKVGSLKRRVRSHLARWEMKNCTPLWRAAQVEVKMHKTHRTWSTFESSDVWTVHAVWARSTFPSQNVQNTPFSDPFWKLRC